MPRFHPARHVLDVAEAVRGKAFVRAMAKDAALANERESGVLEQEGDMDYLMRMVSDWCLVLHVLHGKERPYGVRRSA
jgi:hypothetical protein